MYRSDHNYDETGILPQNIIEQNESPYMYNNDNIGHNAKCSMRWDQCIVSEQRCVYMQFQDLLIGHSSHSVTRSLVNKKCREISVHGASMCTAEVLTGRDNQPYWSTWTYLQHISEVCWSFAILSLSLTWVWVTIEGGGNGPTVGSDLYSMPYRFVHIVIHVWWILK